MGFWGVSWLCFLIIFAADLLISKGYLQLIWADFQLPFWGFFSPALQLVLLHFLADFSCVFCCFGGYFLWFLQLKSYWFFTSKRQLTMVLYMLFLLEILANVHGVFRLLSWLKMEFSGGLEVVSNWEFCEEEGVCLGGRRSAAAARMRQLRFSFYDAAAHCFFFLLFLFFSMSHAF